MLDLQELTLKNHMKLHGNPTLKYIASDTEIQVSRVFRLFNGYEMKLSEYQKFKRSIFLKTGSKWSGVGMGSKDSKEQ
ncbi:MAG: hypothetical protein HQK53_08005 [Oligoflexia bacterium]|nr:hypothetical protein [Oligoflexia bacterium]